MITTDKDRITLGRQSAGSIADISDDSTVERIEPVDLPTGSEWLEIEFARFGDSDGATWIRMGNTGGVAKLLSRGPVASLDMRRKTVASLAVLLVPTGDSDPVDWAQAVRPWFDHTGNGSLVQTVLLTLQGAQILWCPGRIAVITSTQRMESVCRAIVEAAYYETQLGEIEKSIDSGWDDLESDASIAFEFAERFVGRRETLARRFGAVVAIRTRYARLMPHVLVPHVYPPTLASQIGERFRERTRMAERLDLVAEKLEVHERIYDLCGQRVSEFMVARRGHMLEWVIIILLGAQTLLWFVDYLSPATTPAALPAVTATPASATPAGEAPSAVSVIEEAVTGQ